MSEPITKESIKQYLADNKYTKIVFSPKGHSEIWDDLPSNYPDFKVQPGEELPHDNFVNITHLKKVFEPQTGGHYWSHGGSFLKEIKEGENDFLTELFKWAQQEKVKRIEVDEQQWNIVIHNKTQQDYQLDAAAKNWRVARVVNSLAKSCSYCSKQFEFVNTPGDNVNAEKRVRLQHWESCSNCPEEARTLAKQKLGELPAPWVNKTAEYNEYNRLIDLLKNSKDLTELERNWEIVKNSPLYDANKKIWEKYGDYRNNKAQFDKSYDTYKRFLINNNPNDNDNRERERERERESVLAYFQQHNIRSIRLEGNNLIIEYNDSRTETRTSTEPELQQIRSYCQAQGLNTLALTDLQKQGTNSQQPTNYLPWIVGGVGIIAVLGIVGLVWYRKRKKQ